MSIINFKFLHDGFEVGNVEVGTNVDGTAVGTAVGCLFVGLMVGGTVGCTVGSVVENAMFVNGIKALNPEP